MSNITARSNTTATTARSECPCDEGFFPETNSVCGSCRPENHIDAAITQRHGSAHQNAQSVDKSGEPQWWNRKQKRAAKKQRKTQGGWPSEMTADEAAEDRNLKAVDVRVLAVIRKYSNRTLKPTPILQRTIAAKIGMSVETVKRALRRLREFGYVDRKLSPPQWNPEHKQWRRKCNVYTIRRPKQRGHGRPAVSSSLTPDLLQNSDEHRWREKDHQPRELIGALRRNLGRPPD